jgi:DNA-binding NarL/FixJ family response regulator
VAKILIVEDHDIVQHGLRQVLAVALPDAVFEQAADAEVASGLLTSAHWDLVILDLGLPGRSGLDLLRDIRSRSPGSPVLVVTASTDREMLERCLREGAAGYLSKGTAAAELAMAARKLLGGGRYLSPAHAKLLGEAGDLGVEHSPIEALSPRELEVLRLVASGRASKEIGALLDVSEKTVATYRARIGEKLGLSGTAELVRFALKHGLVS